MNSIGAWGAFQLGGIIGCSIGIICIWTAALPVFVAVGAAMIIWALAAFAIHAVDAGTAGLNNQLSGAVVRSSTDFVKTTTGKVVTGLLLLDLLPQRRLQVSISQNKPHRPHGPTPIRGV